MKIYILILFLILQAACESDSQKIAKMIEGVIGKTVELPHYTQAKIMEKTIEYPDFLFNRKLKMIIYTPPLLCTSCNLDCLEEWKIFIEDPEQFHDISIIFKPAKEEELINTLIEFDFNYPVIFDIDDQFIKKINSLIILCFIYFC